MSHVFPPITALGTTWYIELFESATQEKLHETFGLMELFLCTFEKRYSRFISDSEIGILNTTGRLSNPDTITKNILELGQIFYKDTNQIFNILVGEHLLARGYDQKYSFIPKVEPIILPSPLEALSLTPTEITLTAGQIDLGGYGKGFLIDQLAEYLHGRGFQYFLINGGGDMYATSNNGVPISIYLEHPTKPSTYLEETTLLNQGFAASSTHKRRWKVSTIEYSHIVDTRDKNSHGTTNSLPILVLDNFGIYTKAPSTVLADVWATTLLISDPENHQSGLTRAEISFARYNTTHNTLEKSFGF